MRTAPCCVFLKDPFGGLDWPCELQEGHAGDHSWPPVAVEASIAAAKERASEDSG